MTSSVFPKFAGLTWADWRSCATWLACWSWLVLRSETWICPARPLPLADMETDEGSIFLYSVVFSLGLSVSPC